MTDTDSSDNQGKKRPSEIQNDREHSLPMILNYRYRSRPPNINSAMILANTVPESS